MLGYQEGLYHLSQQQLASLLVLALGSPSVWCHRVENLEAGPFFCR